MIQRISLFILSLAASLSAFPQSSPSKFSRAEVLHDLDYLHQSLPEAHYDVFTYTTQEQWDSVYYAEKASITQDSLTLLEATNVLQRLPAAINNGHTGIPFPVASYGAHVYGGGTLFPLEIVIEEGKYFIRKNFSDKDELEPGTEIMSIDGKSMEEVLADIYPQISAERMYFKQAKLEAFSLPRYYWQVYGERDSFEVAIKSGTSIERHSIKAVKGMEGFEAKRNEVLNASMQLVFYESAAYLNPGNFGGDEPAYQRFIDSAFVEMNQQRSPNLIIDLRNNQGGDDSFSDYLVSYFADKPFKWNSSYTFKTSEFLKAHIRQHYDTTQVFWRTALSHENGEIYAYDFGVYQPQPEQKRFSGKVYVLVNRQSHSQSAVAAAQIQDYGFGTIVGEETAECPSLLASIFEFFLPLTGIPVKVSKGYMVRVNGSTDEHGVMPDIVIKDHLLDEEDEILEGLLERLN